jgi:hypothetical protein
MKALSIIDQFDWTKADIETFVAHVLSETEVRQSLTLLKKLTVMEKIIDGVKAGLKDRFIEEAHLEGEKRFRINGTVYEIKTRTSYDYSHCARWAELKAELKSLEEMMKAARSAFVDESTGEVIQPVAKTETEFLSVTLPSGKNELDTTTNDLPF